MVDHVFRWNVPLTYSLVRPGGFICSEVLLLRSGSLCVAVVTHTLGIFKYYT